MDEIDRAYDGCGKGLPGVRRLSRVKVDVSDQLCNGKPDHSGERLVRGAYAGCPRTARRPTSRLSVP
ncbi:hypothetical protein [Streptomyces sp. NPDC013457]|uniref:hypothetical protein n=1 Tax=Streptomyces sp. NPDC013457 TaxID=3364866 RepID=UPI003702F8A5